MFKVKMFLCACLCVLASLPAPARADSIQIHNPLSFDEVILSDLTVYGPNDQKEVILKTNDPNDDVKMSPSGYRLFEVDFKITNYKISNSWYYKGIYNEKRISVGGFEVNIFTKISMIRDPDGQQTVVLEVDQAVATEPPPEGTILAFVDGYNKLMTGWFVGTDINFDTGEVTGPYTGNVEVISTAFEVMVFNPPYPPDGAVNIPLNAKLYWPESEDADWYDVYFGTRSLPTYMGDRTAIDYEPYELEPCTMYYWKVKQVIEHIEEWPDEPEPPDEPDPNEPPDEPDPNEPPDEPKPPKPPPWPPDPNEPPIEMLSIATELVWYEIVEGPTWSFTTGPAKATNPHPIHCATDVDPNAILSWTPGCFADFEDVYLGTDFYAVANADTSDTTGIYRGRQDANSFVPRDLALGTDYYWRIEGGNDVPPDTPDDPWNGDVWSFMTMSGEIVEPPDEWPDVPDPNKPKPPDDEPEPPDEEPPDEWPDVPDPNKPPDEWPDVPDPNKPPDEEPDEPNEPNEPKWETGYKGFYATDHNDVNDPNWVKPNVDIMPGFISDWNTADSNNQIKVTLNSGEYIWFAFINWHDADNYKYFQLILKGNAAQPSNLEFVKPVKGFIGIANKTEVKVRKTGRHKSWPDGKGNVYRRFRYRFGKPQPTWERFQFKAKKDITGKTITIMAWSICGTAEFKKAGGWPKVKSFRDEDPGVESGVGILADIEDYALSISDASFLSQSPGAVIGDPRITDIHVFPDSSTVNTLVPPNFSADPSTGNWTASFVYTDPNGDSRPQGGVRFASDGPGLGTSDRFNLQVFLAGQIDSTYELYAYDQDSGQYMDFGIVVDTLDCIDVVDDFEDYGSDISNRIFETWIDGLGYTDPPPGHPGNGTGAIVGNSEAPVAEQTIVYEGGQSMPFRYDNSGSYRKAFYSETERTFGAPQDWTKDGVEVLTLRFFGDPNNVAEPMYLAVEDSIGHTAVVYHDDPNAVLIDDWTEWNIDLKDFADQGVNLADVSSIAIGVGDRYNPIPGGSGTIYFDDIRLCRPIDVAGEGSPLAADINSDSLVDMADLWVMAEEWLNLRQ